MIINSISVNNYMCYYEENTFSLSKGLNIILGENGEGKTKLFEAIEWLLNGGNTDLSLFVSVKKLDEVSIGDEIEVSASLSAEQYGERYHVTRRFTATKTGEGLCTTTSSSVVGIEENRQGERSRVDGERVLSQIFPVEIRKYSMFKGESELNVFNNADALINLVNMFAEAKYYDKYSKIGSYLYKAANKAVEDSTKLNSKNQKRYNSLEADIKELKRKIDNKTDIKNSIEEQVDKLQQGISDAAKYVENGQDLEIINQRISSINEKISQFESSIDERYTTNLFDEQWILMHFEPVFTEFEDKVSLFGQEKRKMQRKHDQEIGMKKGALKAAADLLANEMPLPLNVPSKEIMEELVRDKICKVCNRPAPEGTEALKFMKKRLQEYIESQKPAEEEEEETLFENNYSFELLRKLNLHNDRLKELRKVDTNIQELLEFNETQIGRIEKCKEELEREKQERVNILGKSAEGEDRLINVLRNYNGWQTDLKKSNKRLVDLEMELKELNASLIIKEGEKEKIDLDTANNYLVKTRAIIKDIEQVFSDTKEEKFDEFISTLQNLSNEYFAQINKGAFTGNIQFTKRNVGEKLRLEVNLMEGDRKLHHPGRAHETSVHISVLFAISKLSQENNESGYPLLMDAPTSSFGETKTGEFLNVISETKNQIIVMLKDYLHKDENTETLSVKPEFKKIKKNKAFWVKLQRPFDENNLKTINTEVIEL